MWRSGRVRYGLILPGRRRLVFTPDARGRDEGQEENCSGAGEHQLSAPSLRDCVALCRVPARNRPAHGDTRPVIEIRQLLLERTVINHLMLPWSGNRHRTDWRQAAPAAVWRAL